MQNLERKTVISPAITRALLDYFDENILKIFFGAHPGRHSIAEEDEVGHHASRIHRDHLTHTSECAVLLFVIANIA